MKIYVWQPLAFFVVGLGFYIYNGVTWNTWVNYLPHIIGYALICGALAWARYRQEQLKKQS
ncbi:MAG: hypothetical protein IJP82_06900 [Bacteroidaceae bacterium]|nr:hypothetical protein [Bacteroidaceae bacterium]